MARLGLKYPRAVEKEKLPDTLSPKMLRSAYEEHLPPIYAMKLEKKLESDLKATYVRAVQFEKC